MFHGCKAEDLPPHIYSTAQRAYKKMIDSRRDQSIVFLGRSGAGKTTNFKHALFYLSLAAGMFGGNYYRKLIIFYHLLQKPYKCTCHVVIIIYYV